jgi:hypothetical protein
MAGRPGHRGVFLAAPVHDERAPGVEMAPGGGLGGIRHVPLQGLSRLAFPRHRPGDGGEQGLGIGMQGAREQLGLVRQLALRPILPGGLTR